MEIGRNIAVVYFTFKLNVFRRIFIPWLVKYSVTLLCRYVVHVICYSKDSYKEFQMV